MRRHRFLWMAFGSILVIGLVAGDWFISNLLRDDSQRLFSSLSQAQLQELHQAALVGDDAASRERIAQLQPAYPELAEQLVILVDRFWITAIADQIAPLLG